METARADRRFFSTTRGRVVQLLRRAGRTVEELAQVLELTDNAVRAHLATLERDGLVQQLSLRRGGGKPAAVYGLTAEAERLFPKAYGPLLRQFLDVLAERVPPETLEQIAREVGHRVARPQAGRGGDLPARVDRALDLLRELGGLVELGERDGSPVIRGYSCPLAAALPGHPEVCRLAEAMLEDVIGAPVRERCERGDPPRCAFEIGSPPGPAAASVEPSLGAGDGHG
jgi:predicted ArsR family transcriptional regulator